MTTILETLQTRRSYKPKYLSNPTPSWEQLEEAARAALRAPDHGALTPYRFVVVPQESREHLADLFEHAAIRLGYDDAKVQRTRSKATKGPMLVAFITCIDPHHQIPAYEQELTAGAAMAHFLLALDAQGFGAITLSGSILEDPQLQSAFCANSTESLAGWFTIGTPDPTVEKPKEARPVPLSLWVPNEGQTK